MELWKIWSRSDSGIDLQYDRSDNEGGPVALRRAGPPLIHDVSFWWACARSELVPPYIETPIALRSAGGSEISSMRIGILSDTHDEIERTRVAVAMLRNAGAEALIHCGDLASPQIVEELAVLPSWFVFGNHDSDMVPHLEKAAAASGVICLGWGGTIVISGRRVGVAHGHLTTDIRRVMLDAPEFLLSGHSHLPSDSSVGTVRRINPGALHRAELFTVALLELTDGKLEFIPVPR